MITETPKRFAAALREEGLRATRGRIRLLQILKDSGRPMGIASIVRRLEGALDQATVYRTLGALAEAGIVRRVDIRHGHADFELAEESAHHHHLTCTRCHRVEDIAACPAGNVEEGVLRGARGFASINSHSFELFGLCRPCAKVKDTPTSDSYRGNK